MREADGAVSVARLGPERLMPPLALVSTGEAAADVLSGRASGWDKGMLAHDEFGRLLGASSFTMPDEPWRPRRRTLQPS